MATKTEKLTGKQAAERSKWCSETAVALRDQCRNSGQVAREWWEQESQNAYWLDILPRPHELMEEFAQRLRDKGYEWASTSGELFAEEDGY